MLKNRKTNTTNRAIVGITSGEWGLWTKHLPGVVALTQNASGVVVVVADVVGGIPLFLPSLFCRLDRAIKASVKSCRRVVRFMELAGLLYLIPRVSTLNPSRGL